MVFKALEKCRVCGGFIHTHFVPEDPASLTGPGCWERACQERCTVQQIEGSWPPAMNGSDLSSAARP